MARYRRNHAAAMKLTSDQYYEAVKARDTRFDGVFYVGVSTTRI